jgi:hypothetical protein
LVAVQIQDSDFYIKTLPKEPWLDGQGYQYSYPIYQRSLITKAVTDADFFQSFATLSATGATGNNLIGTGACSITGYNIDSFAVDVKTVALKKAAVNSPDICLDDFKFQWQVLDQIKNVTRVLAENSKWVWSQTYQTEVIAHSANCVSAIGASPTIETTFDASVPPTSTLSFELLETIHQELGYNGGTLKPTARVDDGTAVYTAVGSNYTFNNLKKLSSNNRNDYRYFSFNEPDVLVGAPGLGGKVYHGFKFQAVQFPPRYDIVTGAYARRYPYSAASASRGQKWLVNDVYKDADYEDTVIYHEEVLRVLIPKPQGNIGGMTYLAQYSWAGEFVWRNIPSRDCNIDGNIGFFRALFAYGIKEERPDLGYVIRHLRCGPVIPGDTGCTGA